MSQVPAFILALVGFGLLALSMRRHQLQAWRRSLPRGASMVLRLAAFALLGLSAAACIAVSGWAIGPVLWFGLMTGAALIVSLGLAYWPSGRRRDAVRPG